MMSKKYIFYYDRHYAACTEESDSLKKLVNMSTAGIDENDLYPKEIKNSDGEVVYTHDQLYEKAGY